MEFPNYMCEGSKGPHIVVLGAFLAGKIFPPSDFVPDQDYGPNIKRMVSAYQIINGVTFENGCGPKTLAMMKKDCFDFEIACRHVIFEPALFVLERLYRPESVHVTALAGDSLHLATAKHSLLLGCTR